MNEVRITGKDKEAIKAFVSMFKDFKFKSGAAVSTTIAESSLAHLRQLVESVNKRFNSDLKIEVF